LPLIPFDMSSGNGAYAVCYILPVLVIIKLSEGIAGHHVGSDRIVFTATEDLGVILHLKGLGCLKAFGS
jgi:hypothetical protein